MKETLEAATPQPTSTGAGMTLVTAPACHFCDDARERLAVLEERGLLRLSIVPAESPEGKALLARHRPGMFPLMVLEGEYFHDGRLPRGKLARLTHRLEHL